MSLIHLDHLSHAYGRHTALDNLSLSIEEGEMFGFLGPNGSGKTTLFRILSTLILPTSGSVRMLDIDLRQDQQEIRRYLGVVFQAPSLDKALTVHENLLHHGHLYGLSGSELRRRMDDLLGRFGLADRRRDLVGRLSGGLRRRVELAKGLLNRPRILLLDEPSTGLDPAARIELARYLEEIRAADGVTVLLTTHLMDEADRCDRLAILDRGQLVACDTPDRLKQRIGGDIITLATRNPAAVRQALRQKFAIEAEEIDHSLRIERAAGHEFIPQLVEALPGMIDSISLGKPTLEDVFIHSTGRRFEGG